MRCLYQRPINLHSLILLHVLPNIEALLIKPYRKYEKKPNGTNIAVQTTYVMIYKL